MKKILIFIAVAATALSLGCSKSSNSSSASSASVVVNGTTYTQYTGADSQVVFAGIPCNVLAVYCKTTDNKQVEVIAFFKNTSRPAAGNYTFSGDLYTITSNQVALIVQDSSSAGEGLYQSDSTMTGIATLTNNGKLVLSLPALKLGGYFTPVTGSSYNDSLSLSGTIKEQ